jgi:hypothetical protein
MIEAQLLTKRYGNTVAVNIRGEQQMSGRGGDYR